MCHETKFTVYGGEREGRDIWCDALGNMSQSLNGRACTHDTTLARSQRSQKRGPPSLVVVAVCRHPCKQTCVTRSCFAVWRWCFAV